MPLRNRWTLDSGLWTLLVFLLLPVLRAPGAEEIEDKYFEGLRRRGLYRLAETYCLDRLARPGIGADEALRLTIELSRTFADHAASADARQAEQLWAQARAVVTELLAAQPQHPRCLLLELQLAQVALARGEEGRWRWQAAPSDTALAQSSRDSLERARKLLESLDDSVSAGLQRDDAPEQVNGFSRYELRGLRDSLRYRLAKVWLNVALLAPAHSADAFDGLSQAKKLLRPLARDTSDGPLQWNSRVALVEGHRLAGELEAAMDELRRIERRNPPSEIVHEAFAARARILLAEGKADRAVKALRDYRMLMSHPSGEMDLVFAEALIQQWAAMADQGVKSDRSMQRLVLAQLDDVRRMQNDYWGRRIDLLVAAHLRAHENAADAALLAQSAANLYRYGQTEGALDLYARAADQAGAEGQTDEAFSFSFAAAGILLRDQRWDEAADRFFALAGGEHSRAGEAHLLGAYARGRQYTSQPNPQHLLAYENALQAHLSRFGSQASGNEARWMFGRLRESQQRWRDAVELYRDVDAAHRRYQDSVLAAGRCYAKLVEETKDQPEAGREAQQEAQRYWRNVLDRAPKGPLQVAELASAVRLAQFWIEARPARYGEALRLLGQILEMAGAQSESPPDRGATSATGDFQGEGAVRDAALRAHWYRAARQWQVLALAATGRIDDAQQQLAELSASRPEALLELMDGLATAASDTRAELREPLGRLQLQAAQLLEPRREQLNEADRFRLDVLSAHAMAYAGQPRRALDYFGKLLQTDPKNLQLQRARAELLMLLDTQAGFREALDLWRRIAKRTRAGTGAWFEAKYQVALCHLKLGDPEQCRKLIEVTRLLHPTLGGAVMRQRFLALAEKCRETSD